VNIPLDFVSGNIHQYSLRLRRIIVKYSHWGGGWVVWISEKGILVVKFCKVWKQLRVPLFNTQRHHWHRPNKRNQKSWIVCSNNQNSFKIVVKRTHLKSKMIASVLKLDLEDKNLSLVNLSRIWEQAFFTGLNRRKEGNNCFNNQFNNVFLLVFSQWVIAIAWDTITLIPRS